MSLVAKLLSPAHIALDLQISSKKRLFEQAGLLFENQDAVARSVVFDSLFEQALLARDLQIESDVRGRQEFGDQTHQRRFSYSLSL